MQIVCPVCFARFAAEAGLNDKAARACIPELVRCGEAADMALRYVGLFRPAKNALSWTRAKRLLAEIADAVEAGAVRRGGRDWPVPPAMWQEGLEIVVERFRSGALRGPPKGHAYLWEVLSTLSDRAAADEERAREERLRSRRGAGAAPRHVGEALSADGPPRDPAVAKAALADMRRRLGRSQRG